MRHFCYCLVFVLFISCSQDPDILDDEPPQPDPVEKPYGVIYSAHYWQLTAYDIEQEKVLWQTKNIHTPDANVILYDNGTLYTTTSEGLAAINANNGQIIWRQRQVSLSAKPVLKDSLLYVIWGSYNRNVPVSIYCVNARTGSVVWNKPIQSYLSGDDPTGSPVVVGDKVIAVGHDHVNRPNNSIYCYNRFNGTLIWADGTVLNSVQPFPFSPDGSQIIFPAGTTGNYGDGLYSFDINSGAFLWYTYSLVVSPRQEEFFQDNRITLLNTGYTATFNFGEKKQENLVTDTIWRATVFKDKIFSTRCGYGCPVTCRDINSGTKLWESPSPYLDKWLTTDGISNSYTSTLVADGDYVYYVEYIFNGPDPSPAHSLFIFDASTGETAKEIKLNDAEMPIGTTFVVVKDNKAYYSAMR